MLQALERADDTDIAMRSFAGWRTIFSAWLLALTFVGLLVAADARGSPHNASPRDCKFAGAVIPRHDPGFPGPDDIAASDWLERARAEAYGGE